MKNLTVIMYHYVREKSKLFNFKGLELSEFRAQLDYLKKKYHFINYQELLYSLNNSSLPQNSCMLTFDDGYKDHIKYVLPELVKRKIKGFFFPSGKAAMENIVLDINLIHAIQSKSISDVDLYNDLNFLLIQNNFKEKDLKVFKKYFFYKSRYDSCFIRYFKEVLQNMKNLDIKNKILELLFKKYVDMEERLFSKLLYLSTSDIKELLNNKMYVGGHGYEHLRLANQNKVKQNRDINKTINFLSKMGAPTKNWIMCYPFGSYNLDTIKILKKKKLPCRFNSKYRKK